MLDWLVGRDVGSSDDICPMKDRLLVWVVRSINDKGQRWERSRWKQLFYKIDCFVTAFCVAASRFKICCCCDSNAFVPTNNSHMKQV